MNTEQPWMGMLRFKQYLLIFGGFFGFKFFHAIDKVFGGNVFSNIGSLFNNTTLKGESSGRINILLAGDSADQINHGGANLTDSVLLLSINLNNHTAFLLSIPRDLWVQRSTLLTMIIASANPDIQMAEWGHWNL